MKPRLPPAGALRVLMFDNEFPPLGGGTGVLNQRLLEEWSRDPDLRVDLVTSSRSANRWEETSFAERIRLFKVPVHNANLHHARNIELIRYFFRGWAQARRLLAAHAYDVSFAFSTVPAGAISHRLWRESGLPYVVSLQGPDIPGFEARYRWMYPWLKPFLRRIWRGAAVVTACSQAHRDLARRTAPAREFQIVPNAVDVRRFTPGVRPAADGTVRCLCVGRLIERKGQAHLLKALAQVKREGLNSIRVTFAGTGDAEAGLKAETAALGLDDRVVFAGVVAQEDMPSLYREADVFVLPSQNEGMSMAWMEAMASGLPLIVTETGGTHELVRDNGVVVPWNDPAALAAALRALAEDPGRRRRMGLRSREIVQAYGWTSFAAANLQACRTAAAQNGRPPAVGG